MKRWAPLLLASCLLGCGTTTRLSDVWVKPGARPTFDHVLVIGVARTATARRTFEDRFATALGERGTEATPSWAIFPGEERIPKSAVLKAVRQRGFDAVIVTRLLEVDEKTTHYPGSTHVVPSAYAGYGMHRYYGYAYDVVHTPPRTVTQQIVRLETHLYDAASAELAWSAQSDTFDPSSTTAAIESVVDAVSARIAEDGLLPTR